MRHGKNTSGEVAAHRHEIDCRRVAGLQFLERGADFLEMLVGKGLVDRYVVGAPAEMGRRAGFDACAGRAGEGRDVDVAADGEQSCRGKRQQRQLYGRCEAAGISDRGGAGYPVAVDFGKAVDIAIAFVAEVLGEVDDLESRRSPVVLPELAAVAMGAAEKQNVDLVERMSV